MPISRLAMFSMCVKLYKPFGNKCECEVFFGGFANFLSPIICACLGNMMRATMDLEIGRLLTHPSLEKVLKPMKDTQQIDP